MQVEGPVSGALAIERPRLRTVGFDHQLVAVTVVPFVLFGVIEVLALDPLLPLGVLAFFLGVPHVLATASLYLDPEIYSVARADVARAVLLPALAVPATAAAYLALEGEVRLFLIAFGLWQTHHFTKQNLGVFSFWCRARGLAGMAPAERRLLLGTDAIGWVGVLRMADVLPDAAQAAGALMVAGGVVAACVLASGARRVALLAAVAFYAPLFVFDVSVPAAAFVYQLSHGAQYLLMVGHTVRQRRTALWSLIPFVVVGGVVLESVSAGSASGLATGLGRGVVASHFIADARLWRLRDPAVRALMKRRFDFL